MTEYNTDDITNTESKVQPEVQSIQKILPTKRKKHKAKKRTLIEFKTWVEGLSEFQEDGWVPNLEQWEHIKSSIDAITENSPVPNVVTPQHHTNVSTARMNPVLPTSKLSASVPSQNMNLHEPSKVKRDIDTSNGHYTSDFE